MRSPKTGERSLAVLAMGCFAAALCSIANVVVAQSNVYRCKGPDGKVSFSDQPCPDQPSARVQPSGKAPSLTDSERGIAARNMGTDLAGVRKIEAACAQGAALACDTLEAHRLSKHRPLTEAERQTVIRNSGLSERTVREIEEGCVRASTLMCGTLHLYKTRTRAQLDKEILDQISRACAQGDRRACEGLTAKAPGERTPEEMRKDKAELDSHLRDMYARRCTEGDMQACREYQKLKK